MRALFNHKTNQMQTLSIDYSKVTNIRFDNIDMKDYPDFCDAYISYAEYCGRPMDDSELDELNDDRQFLYTRIFNQ